MKLRPRLIKVLKINVYRLKRRKSLFNKSLRRWKPASWNINHMNLDSVNTVQEEKVRKAKIDDLI